MTTHDIRMTRIWWVAQCLKFDKFRRHSEVVAILTSRTGERNAEQEGGPTVEEIKHIRTLFLQLDMLVRSQSFLEGEPGEGRWCRVVRSKELEVEGIFVVED